MGFVIFFFGAEEKTSSPPWREWRAREVQGGDPRARGRVSHSRCLLSPVSSYRGEETRDKSLSHLICHLRDKEETKKETSKNLRSWSKST